MTVCEFVFEECFSDAVVSFRAERHTPTADGITICFSYEVDLCERHLAEEVAARTDDRELSITITAL